METATRDSEGRVWHHDGSKATEREVSELLASFVFASKPDVVVETGTFMGHTTRAIAVALGINEHGVLHTVENNPELAAALRPVMPPRVRFHEADSNEWCERFTGQPDLAFVDSGDVLVRLGDVGAIWPKIAPGGLLAVHDTTYYDDQRLLERVSEIVDVPHIEIRSLLGLGVWQKPWR